jgi:hypothetical protein
MAVGFYEKGAQRAAARAIERGRHERDAGGGHEELAQLADRPVGGERAHDVVAPRARLALVA